MTEQVISESTPEASKPPAPLPTTGNTRLGLSDMGRSTGEGSAHTLPCSPYSQGLCGSLPTFAFPLGISAMT